MFRNLIALSNHFNLSNLGEFLALLVKYCLKNNNNSMAVHGLSVRPSLHVDMELADALGLHHVVVDVAHGDGVGGGGVGDCQWPCGKITL